MLLKGLAFPAYNFLFLLELHKISEESSNLFYIYPNWLLFFALEGVADCVCSLYFVKGLQIVVSPACTVQTDGIGQVKSYSLRNASYEQSFKH